MRELRNIQLLPKLSQPLELLDQNKEDPYFVLDTPPKESTHSSYLQVLAFDDAYRCEIRIYGETLTVYRHYFLLLPNENGSSGEAAPDRPDQITGYDPDVATVMEVLRAFTAEPNRIPQRGNWLWFDISEDFDASE